MLRSKALLEDTKCALEMLEMETDPQKQRILWFSCIGMLRSIGHVLDKIDAKEDSFLSSRQKEWWLHLQTKKNDNPHIYWDFIDPERNNTLKEYSIHFEETQVPIMLMNPHTGQSFIYDIDDLFLLTDNKHYQGIDVRDLIAEAITWWEEQISIITKTI